jgi:hypothetical protein
MSKVEIHVNNESSMIISGSGDPHAPGVIVDHTAEAEPLPERPYISLPVKERAENLFKYIWYNGFCNMDQLRQKAHYLETIAERARELPDIVDYHSLNWLLEWQMPGPRVRKLCIEFSMLHNSGRIIAASEKPDKTVFVTPAMPVTNDNIRLAFRWYYTKEHVMFIDKPAVRKAEL